MTRHEIEATVFDLYDEYCHGQISRRQFFERAGSAGALLATAMLPNYASGQEVLFTDERIKAQWVNYPSPGGNSGEMRGYLVQPAGEGPFPAVVVIHENRGLNPYVQDVARRAALAGFLALAPDGLYPVGGYPGNDDEGRVLQRNLDSAKLATDIENSARFVKAHTLSTGKLGATGFCWGGGMANALATRMGTDIHAVAPYYGRAADTSAVPGITAAVQVHYADNDPRVNAMRADYEQALKAADVTYEMHSYPETRHGFHNYSTPRYDAEAAALSWQRTMAWFTKHLT
ncbi:MAG: dienelactone hydrolase family protein [Pseudomonadota bacterium]